MRKFPLLIALLLLPLTAQAGLITCANGPSAPDSSQFLPQTIVSGPVFTIAISCVTEAIPSEKGQFEWNVFVFLLDPSAPITLTSITPEGDVFPGQSLTVVHTGLSANDPGNNGFGFAFPTNDSPGILEFSIFGDGQSVEQSITSPLPEPPSVLLLGIGICVLGFAVRVHR